MKHIGLKTYTLGGLVVVCGFGLVGILGWDGMVEWSVAVGVILFAVGITIDAFERLEKEEKDESHSYNYKGGAIR